MQGLLQAIFGQIYTAEKNYTAAEQAFQKAEEQLQEDPMDILEVLHHKTLLYSAQKDMHNAQKTLQQRHDIISTLEEELQCYHQKKNKELEMKLQKEQTT